MTKAEGIPTCLDGHDASELCVNTCAASAQTQTTADSWLERCLQDTDGASSFRTTRSVPSGDTFAGQSGHVSCMSDSIPVIDCLWALVLGMDAPVVDLSQRSNVMSLDAPLFRPGVPLTSTEPLTTISADFVSVADANFSTDVTQTSRLLDRRHTSTTCVQTCRGICKTYSHLLWTMLHPLALRIKSYKVFMTYWLSTNIPLLSHLLTWAFA